jgi:hypothetical protein
MKHLEQEAQMCLSTMVYLLNEENEAPLLGSTRYNLVLSVLLLGPHSEGATVDPGARLLQKPK